ncbi:MAG TPA: acyl carrier protein [Phycisphaerae bacterium]|nr:acyl carrier protein [Phycisphaerae bacterium]HNU44365.1 acyl carrier protein [Phycisphaerae bacterium]
MAPSRDEVFKQVQEVLSDALGVDTDEVTLEATLQGDLGAESIDFLDIVFRLEKAFSIKIPKGELFPDGLLSNPDYVAGDRLTAAGLAELKASMPHADFAKFEAEPLVSKMPDLFTVNTIINYVESKVAAAPA